MDVFQHLLFKMNHLSIYHLQTTGMTVSQVTDEVLYTGLIEMQELDALG